MTIATKTLCPKCHNPHPFPYKDEDNTETCFYCGLMPTFTIKELRLILGSESEPDTKRLPYRTNIILDQDAIVKECNKGLNLRVVAINLELPYEKLRFFVQELEMSNPDLLIHKHKRHPKEKGLYYDQHRDEIIKDSKNSRGCISRKSGECPKRAGSI